MEITQKQAQEMRKFIEDISYNLKTGYIANESKRADNMRLALEKRAAKILEETK